MGGDVGHYKVHEIQIEWFSGGPETEVDALTKVVGMTQLNSTQPAYAFHSHFYAR